jgi:hypothetical protein
MSKTKNIPEEDIAVLRFISDNIDKINVFSLLTEQFKIIIANHIRMASPNPNVPTLQEFNVHGMSDLALRALNRLKENGLIEHSIYAAVTMEGIPRFEPDNGSQIRLTEKGMELLGLKNEPSKT